MSDGPYKSLPMSRKWKQVAERIHNEAYSPEQVCDALSTALAEDWRRQIPESLVNKVQIVLSNGQTDLFCDQNIQELEALRGEVSGCPLASVFLDYVTQAVAKGTSGEDALLGSTCQAITELAARDLRQVEEHYYREPSLNGVTDVRHRAQEAIGKLDTVAIAHQFLGIGKSQHPRTLAKHTGLDDGVPL